MPGLAPGRGALLSLAGGGLRSGRARRDRLTQEFLAQMLAVQRTTVSQIAGEMQALGLIQQKRGRIAIIDRPGTEARACECLDAHRARWNDVWPLSPGKS
ncbi:helix-turn-helix domain-containing protein [Brevundimonas denitrificans]|uniref:helix-turn-helix domain-containing protein n=1 Tax=Brevundimonas denitrificans TaxID=1443434 RepID=UPI00223B4A1B|nr:helix-turn-helix domain-containing protein [Brevundimonas denitrificans]